MTRPAQFNENYVLASQNMNSFFVLSLKNRAIFSIDPQLSGIHRGPTQSPVLAPNRMLKKCILTSPLASAKNTRLVRPCIIDDTD